MKLAGVALESPQHVEPLESSLSGWALAKRLRTYRKVARRDRTYKNVKNSYKYQRAPALSEGRSLNIKCNQTRIDARV